jgi:tRNA C32,U32 (ribose-2'-O)-methylase TrmJ
MNLGQAVALVAYELRRSGWDAPAPAMPAPAQDTELLIEAIAGLGEALDYPRGHKPADRLGRVRKAMQAALLPASTVHFLLSFMRHVRKESTKTDA